MTEKCRIDGKDLKILELLTEDGKAPLRRLASQLKLSKESVAYRIRRLEKAGVLRHCVAKIDMTRFYQNAYLIMFRFMKNSAELQKERIDLIRASPYVMWVGSLSGEYDLAASFLVRDSNDLTDFIRYVEQGLDGLKYDLYAYSREFKNSFKDIFRTETCLPEPANGFMIRSFSPKQLVEIDDDDLIILYSLSKNAKMTNSDISSITGLSEEGVRQRIKGLEKGGIITGYRYLVNIYDLDLEIYHLIMRFQNLTQEKEEEVKMYVQTHPDIYYAARIIGSYNVTLCLTARDRFHFQDILNEIRNRFSDNVSKYQSQITFGEHKHTYFPPACCRHIKGFDRIENEFEKKYAFDVDAKK